MKPLILFIFTVTALATLANWTQELKEIKLKIDLPSDSWVLKQYDSANATTVYIFKRQPISDSEGREIIPNVGVIIESIEEGVDIITYTALKRKQIPFKSTEIFTHEKGEITFENAIGYRGNYTDNLGLDHTVIVVYGIQAGKGFQVICDSTTDIFEKVEPEFSSILKSLRE